MASGSLRHYHPASRMWQLTWDEELAHLAELNVKQCQQRHDSCRNTNYFSSAGQNLGIISHYPVLPSKVSLVQKIMFLWFNEHKIASMNDIVSFPAETKRKIGHFTAMMRDETTHVGCAIATFDTYHKFGQ